MIGGSFPESEFTVVIGNPLVVSSITYEHVLGHIFWGAVIGLGTLSIRYIILGGSFAIFLDSDHLREYLCHIHNLVCFLQDMDIYFVSQDVFLWHL